MGKVKVKVSQSCLTLCNPMDYTIHGILQARTLEWVACPTLCNPKDYTIHGILQARILEWVVFPFTRGSSQPRNQTRVTCIAGGFFTN